MTSGSSSIRRARRRRSPQAQLIATMRRAVVTATLVLLCAGITACASHAKFRLTSPDRTASIQRTNNAGIVGGEVLRRFVVTFDVRHGAVWLEPTSHIGDAFDYDASPRPHEWCRGKV